MMLGADSSDAPKNRETVAKVWSFALFFSLRCSYYVLRPMRDAIVIEAGDQNLRWMFTATFAAMLTAIPVFGFLTGRWRRERVLTILSLGFSTAFLVFFFLFANQVKPPLVAGTFFVWISVFNLPNIGFLELHGRYLHQ